MRTHFKILRAVLFIITATFFFTYCSDEPSLNSTTSESLSAPDDDNDSFIDPVTGLTVIVYKVFSPVTGGVNWGQATNCFDGSTHPSNYLTRPMDIAGSPSAPVHFKCSANVKSIRRKKITGGLCRNTTIPSGYEWVKDAILVELYSGFGGTGAKIGEVYYGHLMNLDQDMLIDNPNGAVLGYLGDSNPAIPPCYNGIHVHMECSSNGKRQGWDCNASTSRTGKDVVYKFFSDNTL